MGDSGPIVLVEGLVKSYGTRRALDAVSFRVDRGEGLALFGANGAGKTTLLETLAGLRRATGGRALVLGRPAGLLAPAERRALGFVAHANYLYPGLTARENLRFFGLLYRVERLESRIEELLTSFGLWERRDDRMSSFSRGMARRLALSRALLPDPRLLLLDEPYDGLDEEGVWALNRRLSALLSSGATILVSSHRIEPAQALARRALVLERGRVALDRAIEGLDTSTFRDLCRDAVLGRR
ncbi:MAG: ABC transporter ATP-binding protein [Planctomycetes bacterium]|nr:ABC transporter ATP-binding protein [Planctomycetota bacterium]